MLSALISAGCPSTPEPRPVPTVRRPPARRPAVDELAHARKTIHRLKNKLRATQGQVKLSSVLAPDVAHLPKHCDGKGPFFLVDVPEKLPTPEFGLRIIVSRDARPLPGFVVFSNPQHGCGTALQNACLVSFVRQAGALQLRAVPLASDVNATGKDDASFAWKNLGGCLILEVGLKSPFFCAQPVPKKSYRELFGYAAGSLKELLPTLLTGRSDEDGSDTAEGAALTWMTTPKANLIWLTVEKTLTTGLDSTGRAPQEHTDTTYHVLTKGCRLHKATATQHKAIKQWMKTAF